MQPIIIPDRTAWLSCCYYPGCFSIRLIRCYAAVRLIGLVKFIGQEMDVRFAAYP